VTCEVTPARTLEQKEAMILRPLLPDKQLTRRQSVVQNGDVDRRPPIVGAAAVLLLAVSIGFAGFAGLVSASRAAACCARARNQCAGLKTPDECCKRMGHSLAGSTVATLAPVKANAVHAESAAAVPQPIGLAFASTRSGAAVIDFKRPHDPPHLHPFPLLI
jgi:hypothetical protein